MNKLKEMAREYMGSMLKIEPEEAGIINIEDTISVIDGARGWTECATLTRRKLRSAVSYADMSAEERAAFEALIEGYAQTIYTMTIGLTIMGVDVEHALDEAHRERMTRCWTENEWRKESEHGSAVASGLISLSNGQPGRSIIVKKQSSPSGFVVPPPSHKKFDAMNVIVKTAFSA